ncbi:hypothetical protein KIN20_036103 [Parelaphostrongylus tenuis]|uniref:Uncharacterized protein n=1 Tax=Parelaphostrongylus tenuis TaxID=148309 RepID=A0AAD5RCR6_PARTN|nr:hypothetical protein KIN20_036103 [Parelaphostrongylus tenuis]
MATTSTMDRNPDERDLEAHSAYEDALDDSDTELKLLCLAAAKRLTKQRNRSHPVLLPSVVCSPSSAKKHKRTSSSEGSSIEKLADDGQSRRTTTDRNERPPRRSGQKSSSNNSDSPEDWKMVNYTFQDAMHNPLLMQINQQLQILSRQLYDIESANALQLRIIAKLLSKLINAQQRPRYIFTRFLRYLQVLLFVLISPFVVIVLSRLIFRIQRGITVATRRHL